MSELHCSVAVCTQTHTHTHSSGTSQALCARLWHEMPALAACCSLPTADSAAGDFAAGWPDNSLPLGDCAALGIAVAAAAAAAAAISVAAAVAFGL